MSLLSFHQLGQSFGPVDIFRGLSGSVPNDGKVGLVGPNGIGKTTLLRLLAGLDKPTSGQVHVARHVRIGYLQQEAVAAFADHENTVFEEMLTVFAHLEEMEQELRRLETAMGQNDDTALLNTYGDIQVAYEQAGGYDYDVLIKQVLTGLGLGSDHWHMPLAHCSGGQKTRALLARLLLEQPDLLVLDEPTNHLDVAAIEWLEGMLRQWSGALLIVSHDRYFLDKVVNRIWEMGRQGIETYRGNYSAYLRQRDERWLRRDETFRAMKERFIKKLEFIKRNIARASTTDRAKGEMRRLVREVQAVEYGGSEALGPSWSRFVATTDSDFKSGKWSVSELEQHIRQLENPNPRLKRPRLALNSSGRSGQIVLRSEDLVIGYPDAPLFAAADLMLLRQEVAALIGGNGTGKSTFLKTLQGEMPPLAGHLQLGSSLQINYFAQAHETLDPDNNVLEEILALRNISDGVARDHLARYLFRGDEVYKPVAALSGGERGRLALAKLAFTDANLLLLDEPTNHLDIPTQEELESSLLQYQGTILLVSHDRYLIDKLATQIWEVRDGRLHVHPGDYQSYVATRRTAGKLAVA